MRIERLINGQDAIGAILSYNEKGKIVAHEVTIYDLLDYSDPRGEDSVISIMMEEKHFLTKIKNKRKKIYYLLTIKNRVIKKSERVSKQTALKYALA